ncbi:hypothetical protein WJX84_005378 [Apatococcus fuscideae]|uniref:Uncharacterized protein n=1 Tax=Apatococcus fuscideae TaxID=2026836 RepID=A0AAW1T8U7_9CHLO
MRARCVLIFLALEEYSGKKLVMSREPANEAAAPLQDPEQPFLAGHGTILERIRDIFQQHKHIPAQLWLLLAALLTGLDHPLRRVMWHRAPHMPWYMMDALHHILAAAVLFLASWAITAWQAYRAGNEVSKAGYMAFDEPERQASEVELTGGPPREAGLGAHPTGAKGWLYHAQAVFMHALTYRVERIALAGLEQGVLSWAIEEMWRIGFEHHLSPRRAMITSTATIIAIPVLAKLAKQAVSSTLLLASLGVLTGSALLHIAIVAEWTSAWGGHIFGFAWGDLFLAASILLTAWRAVRLATYACRFPALDLAKWAMLPQAVLAAAWLVHEPLDRVLDGPKDQLWAGWSDPICLVLILWFSLSSHALRGVLINKGQAVLAAAQTNNVLTNEQVVALLVGRGFGHVSHVGWLGILGALVLALSTFAANLGSITL